MSRALHLFRIRITHTITSTFTTQVVKTAGLRFLTVRNWLNQPKIRVQWRPWRSTETRVSPSMVDTTTKTKIKDWWLPMWIGGIRAINTTTTQPRTQQIWTKKSGNTSSFNRVCLGEAILTRPLLNTTTVCRRLTLVVKPIGAMRQPSRRPTMPMNPLMLSKCVNKISRRAMCPSN